MTLTQASFACGPVTVFWNQDDSVASINYENEPLLVSRNLVFATISFGPPAKFSAAQSAMITNLFNTIAALPAADRRKKIYLSTKIFEHLNFQSSVPNPWLTNVVWRAILDHTWEWEKANEVIHKGTPYYFMGENYLRMGDVASAYICFYDALEEDKKNYPVLGEDVKSAPAYLTVSLVDNSNNRLHQSMVLPLRSYLDSLLQEYNSSFKGSLDLSKLDKIFLQSDDLDSIKSSFVANLHEIYHLAPLNSSNMIGNDYSKLKVINSLFNLALVVDQILAHRFLKGRTGWERRMANSICQLALHLKLASHFDLSKVRPKLNEPTGTPDTILPSFLDASATYDGKPLDPRMRVALSAYYLRNYGAHHLEGSEIAVKRYEDVLRSIIDGVFVSIETL
jgi:hypothetical protein